MDTSYKSILKATSIFGGLQVIQIVSSIIKSKFIAINLGPAGIGISGILQSTIAFVTVIISLGITSSSVRSLAFYNTSNQIPKINLIKSALIIISILGGFIGFLLILVNSSTLSVYTLNNIKFNYLFIVISSAIIFDQLSKAQTTIFQGLNQKKKLVFSGVISSIIGLIFSLALVFKFKIDGLAYSVLVSSIISFVVTSYISGNLIDYSNKDSLSNIFGQGVELIKIGFFIGLNSAITIGAGYLLKLIISKNGSISELGYFSAGYSMIHVYVGVIFSAMSLDFYPRLSSVSLEPIKSKNLVNSQIEISLILIGPLIVFFTLFSPYFIELLYSVEFLPVVNFAVIMGIGMLSKTLSWPISFILLAREKSQIFFLNELIYNIYTLCLNYYLYINFGLIGLGFSFLISYLIYFFQVLLVSYFENKFFILKSNVLLFIAYNILSLVSCLILNLSNTAFKGIFGILIFVIALALSLYIINARIPIYNTVKNYKIFTARKKN